MNTHRKRDTNMEMRKEQTSMGLILLVQGLVGATLFLLLMGSLSGCGELGTSALDQPPGVDIVQDTIFARADYAEQFLANAYETLPFGPGGVGATPYDKNKLWNDLLASLTDINQSSITQGADKHYYSAISVPFAGVEGGQEKYNYDNEGAWDGIRKAHIFIENVDKVSDMDETTKSRRKGEARMIIAVHYADLFRHFGGVPWVDHAYGPNEDFDLSRLTARATLDSTVAVIDRAIQDLPFALDNPSTESGRFTRASAMGLKCRLLLFGASPLFNAPEPYIQHEAASQELIWFGGEDPSLWQEAAQTCGALIDQAETSGDYYLVDTGNPRTDFRAAYLERESPEVLISTRVRFSTNGEDSFNFILSGAGTTTHNYVQMFPMANGLPITNPASGYDPNDPYANRDPRLYETVLVNGDTYRTRTAELWIGGRERQNKNTQGTATGYRMRKFLTVGGHVGDHFPYLRLPEIYLSYAEALNELNGGPTPEAYEYVNRVRNRVDLGDLPTGLSQQEFREAVLRERVLELGYEEVRWFDMIRWKREEDFTKTLFGMDITRNEDGMFTYEQFELSPRNWQDDWSPKWYLSAFPREEVLKGLTQNPR